MISRPPRPFACFRQGMAVRFGMAALALGILLTASAVGQQVQIRLGNSPTPATEDPYGVYVPTDRTLSRGVARAKERLDDGEFNEALAFLQQLLDREEDVFVDDPSDADRLQGLKAGAHRMIAGLPSAGREMYELLHSAAARRELDAALASGDRAALTQIVRRYLLTAPGGEAAFVLAQIELDRGHPLSAAHLYDELRGDPVAAARFGPQLALLSAISWRAAGRLDTTAEVLRGAAQDYPNAKVELAGRSVALPPSNAAGERLLAWLDESVGPALSIEATTGEWLTARGDAERNSAVPGGAPHWSARWLSRVVNDPRFETFLSTRRELAQQQGLVAIPAARPIATGNIALMRTPQNVVAIDWQTGKRIWETREEESAAREQFLSEFTAGSGGDELSVMSHPLEQRVWDDTLTMSLSSDGVRAYALSGISLTERDDQSAWGIGPGFGNPYGTTSSPTNRLSAYELATEGKLAWEIDGINATGELAGVFFLGAPLAVDGSLYVLAEIRSAIYLLALDPATGELQWRQQLAGLEIGIGLDSQRRSTAAAPSYSAGLLVCPTTAGIVVAIDAIRREFAWVYRYPRQAESFTTIRPGWQNRQDIVVQRGNNRWLDNTAVIADGKVLITPPESNEIHCLELSDGKMLWKKQREKSLFLACVDRSNVLLVGPDSVTALRIADGSAAWGRDLDLPSGALPSGLGYLSAGHYYLPLTNGHVIAIDTTDGAASNAVRAPSDSVGGNLIGHRGSIISQSALFLEKFEQIEVLRERAQAALAADPRNAAAIRDLAEIRRLDGGLDEAVPMLRKAFEIDPDDLLTREMLADTLLEALSRDYETYRADLPLLRQIASSPPQEIELLRLEAQGLESTGEVLAAFDAYLRLIDATSAELTTLSIDPQHTARSDRWIRARLLSLWRSADTATQEQMSVALATRREGWSRPVSVGDLKNYVAYFGELPEGEATRRELALHYRQNVDELETELELLRMARSPSENEQAAGAILLAQWLLDGGRLEEAAAAATSVEAKWSDAAAVGGKSLNEWLADWKQAIAQSSATNKSWPRGRATVEDLPAAAANRGDLTRRTQAEFQLGLRRLRIEQIARPALGPIDWYISQDSTRLIGRDALGRDVYRFNASRRSKLRQFGGNADLVQAAQLGDMLFVTFGGQVVALDTRQRGRNNEADVLWQSGQVGRLPMNMARISRSSSRPVYHTWSQRRRVPAAAGGLFPSLGPVTPHGVVYQDQQGLRSVDPVSGETLWSRGDIASGCELFGDGEFVLAADVDEAKLHVIRMSDGELVEERGLPETPWLLTSGRSIAQLADTRNGNAAGKTLRIVDGVSGKTRFEATYAPAVRMTTLEPNLIAVVEPSGNYELIDVDAAKQIIQHALPIASPPRTLALYRAGNELYLGVNGAARQQLSKVIGLDYPLVEGEIFAFDLESGRPLWPGPAVVDARGMALSQPTDLPVLVFVDRLLTRNASGSGTKLRLLCIDRATGATVYRNDELPDISGGQLRIRARREEQAAVDFEMSAKTIRLTFTDQPRSPEPPANDLVEAPRKSLGRGLWGVGRRMGSALQDALSQRARAAQGNRDEGDAPDNQPQDDD